METVALISSGYMPLPAALGGAVEALDENLLRLNEKEGQVHFHVFSIHNDEAQIQSASYRNSTFHYVRPPRALLWVDRGIHAFAKNVLRKEKHLSYRYILQRLYFLEQVGQRLSRENYDRVLLENHITLFKALQKKGNGQKYAGRYYYHLHNEVNGFFGCKKTMENCAKILTVSEYIARSIEDAHGDLPTKKTAVWRNSVDTDRFSPAREEERRAMRRRLGIGDEELAVLFTGRLSPEKGVKDLALGFRKADLQNGKLVIVGSYFFRTGMASEYEKELHRILEDMGDRVIFTGYIPYEDMPAIYGAADVVALPSRFMDPAPLTVIESMAAGKPLITTLVGGIPEYAKEDGAILLPPDKNLAENIAAALTKLANDPDLARRMGAASRERAESYDMHHYYQSFLKHLDIPPKKEDKSIHVTA